MGNNLLQNKYRYLVPNAVTFLSLSCGIAALLSAANSHLTAAGLLILASYILDLFDGELARRLEASSEFGLQLDSLVDVVSLGSAPAVLAFVHLRDSGQVNMAIVWPFIIAYVLAGAFRLARFNLLPIKEGQTDSVGLTISTAGATLTLAVLSDLAHTAEVVPDLFFLPLIALLTFLMASRIAHPSITWIFSRRWTNVIYVVYLAAGLLWLRLPFVNVWLLFNGGYLSAALVRAGYRALGE
jgi:CDP-diacylglycerol--serine O-phosphatidyltransferase